MVSLEELMKGGEEFAKVKGEVIERKIEKINLNLIFPVFDVAGVMQSSKNYLIQKVRTMKGYNLPRIDIEKLDNVEVVKGEVNKIVGITPAGIRALIKTNSNIYKTVEICREKNRIFCEGIYGRGDCNVVRTLSNIGILTDEFFTAFINLVPRPIKVKKGGINIIKYSSRSPLWNNTFSHRIDEAFFNIKEIFNIAMEERGVKMEIDLENLLIKFV